MRPFQPWTRYLSRLSSSRAECLQQAEPNWNAQRPQWRENDRDSSERGLKYETVLSTFTLILTLLCLTRPFAFGKRTLTQPLSASMLEMVVLLPFQTKNILSKSSKKDRFREKMSRFVHVCSPLCSFFCRGIPLDSSMRQLARYCDVTTALNDDVPQQMNTLFSKSKCETLFF